MSTVGPVSRRVFVSTKAVYGWSLALLVVCGALVAPFFAHHDLQTLYMTPLERCVDLPLLLYCHELLHVIGFRISDGVSRADVSIRFSRRRLIPHVALRVPVSARRLRFASLLPGVLTGVTPLVVGARMGNGKLLIIGALMTAAAGGDVAIVVALRGRASETLVELTAKWTS